MSQGRLWVRLSIVLFLALLTRILIGSPPKPALSGVLRPRTPVTVENLHAGPRDLWLFTTGLGGAASQDRLGWAVSWGLFGRALYGQAWFAGVDFGVNYWGDSPFSGRGTAFGLSVLPGFQYRFEGKLGRDILPYLGAAMGAQLRSHSGGSYLWYWQTVLRSGLEFRVADPLSLAVDIRVGLLGSDFLFLPQINGVFAL